jgi:hypothetical protein
MPTLIAPGGISLEDGWRIQIRILLSERDDMQEEIRQLRAAVTIYAEIVRRLDSMEQAA